MNAGLQKISRLLAMIGALVVAVLGSPAPAQQLTFSGGDPAPRMMEPAEPVGFAAPARGNYLHPRAYPQAERRLAAAMSSGRSEFAPRPRARDIQHTSVYEVIPPGESFGPTQEVLPPAESFETSRDEPPNFHAVERHDAAQMYGAPGPYDSGEMYYGPEGYGQYDENGEYDGYPDQPSPYWPGYPEVSNGPQNCHEPAFDTSWIPGSQWLHSYHNFLKTSPLFAPSIWQNFNEFGGVQAFKGPVDEGVNGNFGFHKGVNWASPLWDAMGIGFQLGGQIAVSDLEGHSGSFGNTRDQYFVTTGFFRRACCNRGLQGGAVFDYLHDNFYVTMNLAQIRAEIAYLYDGHEFGVWTAAHTKADTQIAPATFTTPTVTWQSTDQYNMYYRRRFCSGAIGRMWIGLTSHADVLFGSDATVPFSERWAIQTSYNYLLPHSNGTQANNVTESWGLTIALVWYPGYKTPNACYNPYRPLFTVADNNSMFLRLKN